MRLFFLIFILCLYLVIEVLPFQLENVHIYYIYQDKDLNELISIFKEKSNTLVHRMHYAKKYYWDNKNERWLKDERLLKELRTNKPLVKDIYHLVDDIRNTYINTSPKDKENAELVIKDYLVMVEKAYGKEWPPDEEEEKTNEVKEIVVDIPQKINFTPSNPTTRNPVYEAIVIVPYAIVYQAPDIYQEQLGRVEQNRSVRVYRTFNGFAQIELGDKFGWVELRFISQSKSQAVLVEEADRTKKETVAAWKKELPLPEKPNYNFDLNNVDLKEKVKLFSDNSMIIMNKLLPIQRFNFDAYGNPIPSLIKKTLDVMEDIKKDIEKLELLKKDIQGLLDIAIPEDRRDAQKIIDDYIAFVGRYYVDPEELKKKLPKENGIAGGRVSFTSGQHTRTKSAMTYFPDSYISLYSNFPAAGNFRAIGYHVEGIQYNLFKKSYGGADWRLDTKKNLFYLAGEMQHYTDEYPYMGNYSYRASGTWEHKLENDSKYWLDMTFNGQDWKAELYKPYNTKSYNGSVGGIQKIGTGDELYLSFTNTYQQSQNKYFFWDYMRGYASYKLKTADMSSFNISGQWESNKMLGNPLVDYSYYSPWAELRMNHENIWLEYGLRGKYYKQTKIDSLSGISSGIFLNYYSLSTDSFSVNFSAYHTLNKNIKIADYTRFDLLTQMNVLGFLVGVSSYFGYSHLKQADSLFWHYSNSNLTIRKALSNSTDTFNIVLSGGSLFYLKPKPLDTTSIYNSVWPSLSVYGKLQLFSFFSVSVWASGERKFYFRDDPYLLRKRLPYSYTLGGRFSFNIARFLEINSTVQYQQINIDYSPFFYFFNPYMNTRIVNDWQYLLNLVYKFDGILL